MERATSIETSLVRRALGPAAHRRLGESRGGELNMELSDGQTVEVREHSDVAMLESKLAAVRRAAEYSFPTCNIDQMLKEIESPR